jgi:uncharacterized protein YecT (DUF1311 family)
MFFLRLNLAFWLAVLVHAKTAPSFDCSKKFGLAEKLICENENLSRLDREMAANYSKLEKELSSTEMTEVRKSQREWIARRSACASPPNGSGKPELYPIDCISRVNLERIGELQELSHNDCQPNYAEPNRNGCWYKGSFFEGVDKTTFHIIKVLEEGPDPWSGPVIYAKDKHGVYYGGGGIVNEKPEPAPNIIKGADPSSFQVVSQDAKTSMGYAKDKNHVYYGRSELIGMDPKSFVEMSPFAKDAHHVYCKGVLIPADPKTFELLDIPIYGLSTRTQSTAFYFYGRDFKKVFFLDKEVKQADSATFKRHDLESVSGDNDSVIDASDKAHKFSRGKAVARL